MLAGLTGQVNYDVLLAALILCTSVYFGYLFYLERLHERVSVLSYTGCVMECLRVSDLLVHTLLAVDRGGIKASNVVDCNRVPEAYNYLSSKGFEGYVSCADVSVGFFSECRIVRRVVWRGKPVDLEVGR